MDTSVGSQHPNLSSCHCRSSVPGQAIFRSPWTCKHQLGLCISDMTSLSQQILHRHLLETNMEHVTVRHCGMGISPQLATSPGTCLHRTTPSEPRRPLSLPPPLKAHPRARQAKPHQAIRVIIPRKIADWVGTSCITRADQGPVGDLWCPTSWSVRVAFSRARSSLRPGFVFSFCFCFGGRLVKRARVCPYCDDRRRIWSVH